MILFHVISLDFANFMNSFSVQLCCQPSHLLLDESKVFFSNSNSYHCRMIGKDIVKSEREKKESNFCRFREYFNKLLVHLCSSLSDTRADQVVESLLVFFSRATFVEDLASSLISSIGLSKVLCVLQDQISLFL